MRKSVFILEIAPVPASRPRVTKYGTYYSARYEQFRKDVGKLLLGKRRGNPYTEQLILDVTFSIPIPKSIPEGKRLDMDETYCVSNVDLDNLEKAIYDSMNGVIYEDDKQIVRHTTQKLWTTGAGQIEIGITVV